MAHVNRAKFRSGIEPTPKITSAAAEYINQELRTLGEWIEGRFADGALHLSSRSDNGRFYFYGMVYLHETIVRAAERGDISENDIARLAGSLDQARRRIRDRNASERDKKARHARDMVRTFREVLQEMGEPETCEEDENSGLDDVFELSPNYTDSSPTSDLPLPPKIRETLIRHGFGTVYNIRAATDEELLAEAKIGPTWLRRLRIIIGIKLIRDDPADYSQPRSL